MATSPIGENRDNADGPRSPFNIASFVRPELLGFSFHLAWLSLFMYNLVPGFMGSGTTRFNALNPVYLYSMVSLVVVLAFGITRTHTFMRFAYSQAAVIGMPLTCSVGTLFYVLCSLGIVPGAAATALLALGGVLTGASSAVMAAHWAAIFGRAKARAVVMNFTLLLAIVLIVCLLVAYLFPIAALVLASLLPLASGASITYAERRLPRQNPTGQSDKKHVSHKRLGYGILILGVELFGVSIGCLSRLCPEETFFEQAFYSVTSLIFLIVVGILVYLEEKRAFVGLFVIPLVALAIFALPFVRFTDNDVSGVLSAMGNVSIELILLFEAVLFALLFDYSCARTFMIARVTMALSGLAGSFAGTAITSRWGDGIGMQIAGSAILIGTETVIAALLIAYFVFNKNTPQTVVLNTEAAGVLRHNASTSAEPDGAEQSTRGTGNSLEPDPVQEVVAKFGLSPREADVLRLLVAGDSATQIQDKLCIAAGTYNYHMHNIYSKLGIHSRRELLSCVYKQEKQ